MQSTVQITPEMLQQTEIALKASPREETHSCDQYRALLDRELEDEMLSEKSVGDLLEQTDRNIEQEIYSVLECPHPPYPFSRRLKNQFETSCKSLSSPDGKDSSLPEMVKSWRKARNRALGLAYEHLL
eukprot:750113-Hanusia_phi.AAC.3